MKTLDRLMATLERPFMPWFERRLAAHYDSRDMAYYGAGVEAPWWIDDDIAEGLPFVEPDKETR